MTPTASAKATTNWPAAAAYDNAVEANYEPNRESNTCRYGQQSPPARQLKLVENNNTGCKAAESD